MYDPVVEIVLAITDKAGLAAAVDDAYYVLHKKSGALMELSKTTPRNLIKDKPTLLEAFNLKK